MQKQSDSWGRHNRHPRPLCNMGFILCKKLDRWHLAGVHCSFPILLCNVGFLLCKKQSDRWHLAEVHIVTVVSLLPRSLCNMGSLLCKNNQTGDTLLRSTLQSSYVICDPYCAKNPRYLILLSMLRSTLQSSYVICDPYCAKNPRYPILLSTM